LKIRIDILKYAWLIRREFEFGMEETKVEVKNDWGIFFFFEGD